MESNTQYKPGDVANGYVLNEQGQWVPLIPAGPTTQYQPQQPQPRKKKTVWVRWYMICAYVLVGLIILGSVVGGDDTKAVDHSTPAVQAPAAAAPTSPKATPKPAPAPKEETQQDKFMAIVNDGQDAADGGNEIEVVQARKDRAATITALLSPSLEAKNWTGTVEDVSTTMGGDSGVLSIDLGNDVAVQTWNNGLSDIGSDTLIDPSSDLFAALADLEEGDEVTFSGHFVKDGDDIQEQSLMDENGMLTPDFSFKFTSVQPA